MAHGDHGAHASEEHSAHAGPARPAPRAHAFPTPQGHEERTLYFDAPSGLAGDMVVASLIDLGVPEEVVRTAIECLPLSGFHVHVGQSERSGIVATTFDVHVDAPQPPRDFAEIRDMLVASDLASDTKRLSLAFFEKLADAEARIHGTTREKVHFHEVGAIDSIVDMVAAAAALSHVGASRVLFSPLPMGRGLSRSAHGIIPLPAPATLACLAGFALCDGGAEFEFVTPTGAAIAAVVGASCTGWPPLRVDASGFGAGQKELKDRPNVLRAVLGRLLDDHAAKRDTHVVIETNVDDCTGELAGFVLAKLLESGALDAWATPITMKKGRPGLTISALADWEHERVVTRTLLSESTTLGVRSYAVRRTERPREMLQVETQFGVVPVKVSRGPFGPPVAKPEFDACAALARTHGVPLRTVLSAATLAAHTRLGDSDV